MKLAEAHCKDWPMTTQNIKNPNLGRSLCNLTFSYLKVGKVLSCIDKVFSGVLGVDSL